MSLIEAVLLALVFFIIGAAWQSYREDQAERLPQAPQEAGTMVMRKAYPKKSAKRKKPVANSDEKAFLAELKERR